jgi:hypothetical protein
LAGSSGRGKKGQRGEGGFAEEESGGQVGHGEEVDHIGDFARELKDPTFGGMSSFHGWRSGVRNWRRSLCDVGIEAFVGLRSLIHGAVLEW